MPSDNSNNNFKYPRDVAMEEVASNKDEYIIPECQEACKKLWNLNIFTSMCSNRDNGDDKFILVSQISPSNEKIFKRLVETNPQHYFYSIHDNLYGIRTSGDADTTSQELVDLVSPFEMQDVLEGYLPIEKFLMKHFNLTKLVHNPAFKENLSKPRRKDFKDDKDFRVAYDRYTNKLFQHPQIKVFDESKMRYPIEEYLKIAGALDLYDSGRRIVYNGKFYKDAHLRYLEYLKKQNTLEER